DTRREPQRSEVDEAAVVDAPHRLPVALDARRVRDPAIEVSLHRHATGGEELRRVLERRDPGNDVEHRRPLPVRGNAAGERDATGVDAPARRRGDGGDPAELLALVAEDQLLALDLRRVLPFLLQVVL